MKVLFFVFAILWTSSSHSDPAVALDFHLLGWSKDVKYSELRLRSDLQDWNAQEGRRFLMDYRDYRGGFVALKVLDYKATLAVLNYLSNRANQKPVQLFVKGTDVEFFPNNFLHMAFSWKTLLVETGSGDLVELENLASYLRYRQGLFSYGLNPSFVKESLDQYFESNSPHFGEWRSCSRILSYVPGYEPEPQFARKSGT